MFEDDMGEFPKKKSKNSNRISGCPILEYFLGNLEFQMSQQVVLAVND